jgi:G1/S-specific cyclin-E1
MKLQELDLNAEISRPYKKVHLDLKCNESLESDVIRSKTSEMYYYLHLKEETFIINPLYLVQVQIQITGLMRTTLLNWLMETCNDLLLKRETFHLSVSIIDKYLSSVKISRKTFQLLGVSALFIASKIEEIYSPRISDFEAATGDSCSMAAIVEMEKKLLKSLNWRILPVTMFNWCNWMMTEWDNYDTQVPLKFKYPCESSYRLYRQVIGIIDAVVLDDYHLRYKRSALTAGVIYLVLHREACTQLFSASLIPSYESWLEYTLGIGKLDSLNPVIEYLRQFLGLAISYELPKAKDLVPKDELVSHYEDFLAYQTYTTEVLPFVKARLLSRYKF